MQYNQKAVDVAAEVSKAVFGKPQTIRTIWMAMLAGGHVLIEDIPGVGKTTLALAFARALELNESRVQFTPDVLPSDIVGFTVFQKETGRLVYHPGSVMCNLFLGDEINRTSSRTQSALLEVMEEGTVTVDGVTHPVPAPFTVIATENPVGAAGTQMLPQSQLDRFTVCVVMGYPDTEAEMQMLAGRGQRTLLEQVHPVANQADLLAMQKEVAGVFIHELMYRYIVDLAQASRKEPRLALGLSPRASLALAFARALELNESRVQYTPDVLPSDIVGFTVFQKETGRLVYHPGSVMCNLFLGDEINRTSSRTQSALLEVMEEGTVTVDGVTHPVPAPFTVIATENPVGAAGTQMLPQSQLDRFTVCVVMGYPDTEAEMQMLAGRGQRTLLEQVHPVANQADLLAMQKEVAGVFIHELMYRYIVDLAQASRKDPRLALGLSPRASLALAGMARAAAYLAGRDFVAPQDVTAVFADVARHRLVLADQAKAGGETVDVVIDDLLRTVPRPRPEKADRHGR